VRIDIVQFSGSAYNPRSIRRVRATRRRGALHAPYANDSRTQRTALAGGPYCGVVLVDLAGWMEVRLAGAPLRCIIGISASTLTARRTHGGVSVAMAASVVPPRHGSARRDVDEKQRAIPLGIIAQESVTAQALQQV
jgi:hypothetical protein